MKMKALILSFVLATSLLAGCGAKEEPKTETSQNTENQEVDAVTTASLVNDEAGLVNAVSKDGTWIIATLSDITSTKELVVEGEFHDKADASKDLYRKLAPYTQDEDHNILERFTITAPKMTVKSPNTRLQGGTFVGDVYVEANGFNLSDAKIEGNVYFANDEYKASSDFSKGEVTGATEVKGNEQAAEEVDAVTTASLVNDEAGLVNAVSKDGTWIIATLSDITSTKELVVEGEFHDKADASKDLYRKLAPYTQDENHKILERFTITAPKMTVKSPNTRLQGGTFVGDIYVEADGFNLSDAKVEGNVYFASEEYKSSADLSKGEVTGVAEVK